MLQQKSVFTEIKIVKSDKYLGYTLTIKLSLRVACREYSSKSKGKTVYLMKTVWPLGSFDSSLFFKLLDSQVKLMLLYASQIWETMNKPAIETAHLFACERLRNKGVGREEYAEKRPIRH